MAARIDGCNWLELQRYVYWPAVINHAAIVWLVVLILCFGEVGTTVLLAPPAWPVASVRAATLIHFGVYRDLAVLALLSVVYIVLPWLLLVYLVRRTLGGTHAP
jgi:ABC-type Fe3+ transport system permease subunit